MKVVYTCRTSGFIPQAVLELLNLRSTRADIFKGTETKRHPPALSPDSSPYKLEHRFAENIALGPNPDLLGYQSKILIITNALDEPTYVSATLRRWEEDTLSGASQPGDIVMQAALSQEYGYVRFSVARKMARIWTPFDPICIATSPNSAGIVAGVGDYGQYYFAKAGPEGAWHIEEKAPEVEQVQTYISKIARSIITGKLPARMLQSIEP